MTSDDHEPIFTAAIQLLGPSGIRGGKEATRARHRVGLSGNDEQSRVDVLYSWFKIKVDI